MFTPPPRPKPEDVGCTVWKKCERKCDKCETCRQFNLKLKDLLPNDTQSKFQRQTFEWIER
jgi:hypothetical protein